MSKDTATLKETYEGDTWAERLHDLIYKAVSWEWDHIHTQAYYEDAVAIVHKAMTDPDVLKSAAADVYGPRPSPRDLQQTEYTVEDALDAAFGKVDEDE